MSEEPNDYLRMADGALEDLQKVEGISERMFWNSLYYALFYAAKAALLSLGHEPTTHRGTDRLVGKALYKEEDLIEVEDAKLFSRMRTVREEIDYNPFAKIDRERERTKDEVTELIEKFREIASGTELQGP